MLNELKQKALKEIQGAKDLKTLEELYRQFLGRKGELTAVLRSLKDLPEKERREKGKLANQIKLELENIFNQKKSEIRNLKSEVQDGWIDITAPGILPALGHFHPITKIRQQAEEIFQSMGFTVAEGPEAETEYYNFDALNTPPEHPARDMTDTFWLKNKKLLLRTHTSPVQIRYMESHNPPLRIIAPGRVFRHEATDASHDVQFYQIEGLMIDKDVSAAHFRGILQEFFKRFFGPEIKIRLRPSYFPFVEPGFEIDIKRGKGDWLELMGAGMVHPNVLKAVKYNPNLWQGFAFGMGLDRLAMIKYKIDDIRLFYSGDLRFLKQF
ncbi:MAG: phenylalanine--tRNA ligase subunit alpha [Candidatus Portnoybacteria bacterium RIFCSPLOWO2_01_FULL_43_11]|uniref:Phenylalanine--tRNA ligase alpha subunit n=3 Tax=Candidatus Portnoyibacteriota TaxID=1817913 RepID=A0A1G2FCU6_9BACT|nr:MAG: phenylalanine--tRNA ligase subunit alpha [Candidatus Portnoybacteria bacterium RIFCSPHIGHO2_01_FULL_40_12b]OGZ37171.1 MAG: phenylalanine--tRNA ligase subunit alpha [Candidatus Portnoybacteria bacterium RIFCSPHIGHO2_02_FULL_40_23]OGZ38817.1 MAG: phenylalanine--tRNA ligase subunit alpha [Candidatus Portnoybacteria bacterium RIFCSPLOWO2_01_FULL_43_11]OGZ40405.1 MAG: phenylalanine--tRNA ligase subunit alpha [Candidatus Portnoybacteria bacterium RIFCSPLOWO2_02_FULL_40_15]